MVYLMHHIFNIKTGYLHQFMYLGLYIIENDNHHNFVFTIIFSQNILDGATTQSALLY